MKGYVRGLALILSLPVLMLVLSACVSSKSMEVTYIVRSAEILKSYTVYLVVNDKRHTNDLVGPEAKQRGMFEELKGGHFDLRVELPTGSKVIMTNMSTIEAVREAANRRLTSQGVTSTNIRAAAQLTMEVNIDDLYIDVIEGDLVATVALSTAIYREADSVAKSNAHATSNRMKLIGGTGGAGVLSEALTQAMNDLDFSGINRF